MINANGYATDSKNEPLSKRSFRRNEVGSGDVRIDVSYCGVCHSDLHQARDEWGGALATNYPCMPGHEIAGTIAQVGDQVTKFAVGDRVAVGCMISSCRECDACKAGLEQFCVQFPTLTYNVPDPQTGEITFGGYSDVMVVREEFVLRVPDGMELSDAAPIVCSGVTTFSPLRHWNVGSGTSVAIAGTGGLGQMAIQLARAMGADVTALTHSADRVDEAKELGASSAVVMTDDEAVENSARKFDLILSTVPKAFDLNPYLGMLKRDGNFVSVGCLEPLESGQLDMSTISFLRQSVSGSFIGGIPETQEVLDFCQTHGVKPRTEITPMNEINNVFDRMEKGFVPVRYVLDLSTL